MDHDTGRITLDIYVLPSCLGYDRARQLANAVRRWELPGVDVSLIDLSDPANVRPRSIFAAPTWVLNGRVLSLGNPELDWLCYQLTIPLREST